MKKLTLFAITLFLAFAMSLHAQVVNLNPDPNGDPWIAGGLPEITPEIQAEIDAIPIMTLSPLTDAILLPSAVDNSQNIFMRPIFLQDGVSCGPASGVGYTFTYEINRLRNLPANDSSFIENWYPPLYTSNFLNGGNAWSGGSWYFHSWDIIKDNGCPNVPTWGGAGVSHRRWMTGYENYYSGMNNRVESYYIIEVGTTIGLHTFKHWINDHNAGENNGGLACFGTEINGFSFGTLPPESSDSGKSILSNFFYMQGSPHAMTFVGYNDSVKYDINGDGLFTNDMDTNGDGIVDMLDWEIGALKIANSYGILWPSDHDSGFVYFPYRLLPKRAYNPNNPAEYEDAVTGKHVYVIKVKETSIPVITVKSSVSYPCRNNLKFMVGYASNANQNVPIEDTAYHSFNFQGGCHPMQGNSTDPLEVGLDYGYWFSNNDVGKIFFTVDERDSVGHEGTINYFSVIDYRWGERFELFCSDTNVSLNNNTKTVLSIDYDLIPFDINKDHLLSSNMVCRRNPIISNRSALTIANGVKIDVYNSNLTFEAGTSLIIGDSVTFTAKMGNDTLFINGNISMGNGVTFNSSVGTRLIVYLNNRSVNNVLENCNFQATNLTTNCSDLRLKKCKFTNAELIGTYGNIDLDSSIFSNSFLRITHGLDANKYVYINHSSFSNYNGNPIYIDDYQIYKVENSIISNNTGDGIAIFNSGFNLFGANLVSGNNISNNGHGVIGSPGAGIKVYHSYADIHNNLEIANNAIGVMSLNNSQLSLRGNQNARYCSQTQQIKDNTRNQVYATINSFPFYYRWNSVVDEDNQYPLVYYSSTSVFQPLNIQNNYWGTNFNPATDLFPSAVYTYLPVWQLLPGLKETDVAEQAYNTAQAYIDQEDYSSAKSVLKQITADFPGSQYAQVAMKRLFELEPSAGNNFMGLKTYYDSIFLNHSDTAVRRCADFLGNFCEIKQENWPGAINWFENKIEEPESIEDSVFSIIDLGYTYFLMDSSKMKSSHNGRYLQYKFDRINDFEINRDSLLSLLFKSRINSKNNPEIVFITGCPQVNLKQNSPNPFYRTTIIQYELIEPMFVNIKLYNTLGEFVKLLENSFKEKGVYQIPFNAGNLPGGIYLYTMEVNGNPCETRKMKVLN